MKKTLAILSFLLLSSACFSQSAFDKALKNISNDLAGKLKLQDKKKLVVLFVTDINRTTTTAGNYLADNISYNLVNDTVFKVFERENLSSIAEVKALIDEGYIDAEKTKRLGKILSVNAVIVGTYTVLSNSIKLSLKALSSSNGVTIAASMMDLPLNADAGAILGIKILAPGENASKNPNCKGENTGDYCFTNSTNKTLYVELNNVMIMSLTPQQTQCKYNLLVKSYSYKISNIDPNAPQWTTGGNKTVQNGVTTYSDPQPQNYEVYGEINVEQCKSKTFVIK